MDRHCPPPNLIHGAIWDGLQSGQLPPAVLGGEDEECLAAVESLVAGSHHGETDNIRSVLLTPAKPADWETVKSVIEDLYIDRNVRLKDVIEIMQTVYKFRATPRMYKAQFARWHWHKYSTSSSESSNYAHPTHSGLPGGRKKGTARTFSHAGPQLHLLEPDESRHLTTTMSATRLFILGWAEQDPRWKTPTAFSKMGGYNATMISHFIAALKHLQRGEVADGGRLLRCAFLELEDVVADGHLAAIWDCCVSIPQLALNHARGDILLTFLRYLAGLAAARMPSHPLTLIARSTLAFVEHYIRRGAGTDAATCSVSAYTAAAWRLWTDTMNRLLGPDNISTIHTTRTYLLIQPHPPDAALTRRVIADYNRLITQATSTLGPATTTTLSLKYDALLTQLRFALPAADWEPRINHVLHTLATKEGNHNLAPAAWASDEDRQIYRGSWCLAAFYALQVSGDRVRARVCLREFLAAPPEGDWVQFAVRLEEVLMGVGEVEAAEEVRRRRGEVQLPRGIVEILEREERALEEGV
ncbi:Clr5 domain-containing protein [Podospora appendiculata]|uniref:Clr5 domain-containing protein n=1 Tax=Podospora appendiculata TaxID=314037 RepID=A0AAE0XLM9_9PEZI|nr:Clr5 domain-containing protein [Podospora appendiculata]